MAGPIIEMKLTGQWWIRKLFEVHARTFGMTDFDRVAKELADNYKKKVLNTMKTEGRSAGVRWEPLKASTRATKKGRKLLLDTYRLRRSLKVWKADGGFYVGYQAKKSFNDRGVDMAVIAQTHEEGRTMRILVTEQMVKAFLAKLAKYGKNTKAGISKGKMKVGSIMVIKIPARSFLKSTYEASFKGKNVEEMALKSLIDVSPLIRGLFKYIKL